MLKKDNKCFNVLYAIINMIWKRSIWYSVISLYMDASWRGILMLIYNYVVCALFWMVFTLMLLAVGKQLCKKATFSESLIWGYLCYSFPVAVGGMIVQIFDLPWICFTVFMAALWIVFIVLLVISTRKEPLVLSKNIVQEYVKNNWMIYLTMIILIGLILLYYAGFWLGNHQDDGYYITKVATLPYSQTGGNFVYPLGVEGNGFNSYIVNTWEIEASVYVKILNVEATLFLRFFQSVFIFFLYLNLIKAFTEKIVKKLSIIIKESIIQLPVVIVVLFNIHYLFLSDTYFFRLRDMFMVNTGMFLGSSIVKMTGIFFLLFELINCEKITKKTVALTGIISVILMSKSTISLPIIMLTVIAFLFSYLLLDSGRKGKYLFCILGAVYMAVAIILPNQERIQRDVYGDVTDILNSPVLWICLIIFIVSFSLRSRIIFRINMIVGTWILLVLVPEINDFFELFSIYNFVGGRAVASFVYFFVVLNTIYLMLILLYFKAKIWCVKLAYIGLTIGLAITALVGFKCFGGGLLLDQPRIGGNIRTSLAVIKNNPFFIPGSTRELGEKLNDLSNESGEPLYVVTPKMVARDSALHPLSTMLRIYAPKVVIVSAAERYPVNDGSALGKYVQSEFENFEQSPSDESAKRFWKEIGEMDINCIVVQNKECGKWMEEKGYSLYGEVSGLYYIWYRQPQD